MKEKKLFYIVSTLALLLIVAGVSAEIFKYEDSDGKVHYVDSESKIPEEYKSKASGKDGFPEISKVSTADRSVSSLSEDSSRDENTSDPDIDRPRVSGKLEVFVAEWCGHCQALEKALTEEKIPYERFDIENSPVGKQEYINLGRGGVPISRVNGSTIIRGNYINKIKDAMSK
jgi:glutaredoxin